MLVVTTSASESTLHGGTAKRSWDRTSVRYSLASTIYESWAVRFTQYDLGFQETGSVVEVTLSGTEANVQLLDSTALTNYKARRSYQYVGGHYRQSPVRLSVPHAGSGMSSSTSADT